MCAILQKDVGNQHPIRATVTDPHSNVVLQRRRLHMLCCDRPQLFPGYVDEHRRATCECDFEREGITDGSHGALQDLPALGPDGLYGFAIVLSYGRTDKMVLNAPTLFDAAPGGSAPRRHRQGKPQGKYGEGGGYMPCR